MAWQTDNALSPSSKEALRERVPVGTLGAPSDVSHLVMFLASPSARYVNGAVLSVDACPGGQLLVWPDAPKRPPHKP